MKQSPLEEKLSALFTPVLKDMGYALVLVRVKGAQGSQIVEVLAENPETRNLGVDECAKISRDLSALMDVEDPIQNRYRLEVSSPGIARPLTRIEDYEDFKGFEAKIRVNPPIEGQKRFRGRLDSYEGQNIILETDLGPVTIDYAVIEEARLVLTDELISATKRKA